MVEELEAERRIKSAPGLQHVIRLENILTAVVEPTVSEKRPIRRTTGGKWPTCCIVWVRKIDVGAALTRSRRCMVRNVMAAMFLAVIVLAPVARGQSGPEGGGHE